MTVKSKIKELDAELAAEKARLASLHKQLAEHDAFAAANAQRAGLLPNPLKKPITPSEQALAHAEAVRGLLTPPSPELFVYRCQYCARPTTQGPTDLAPSHCWRDECVAQLPTSCVPRMDDQTLPPTKPATSPVAEALRAHLRSMLDQPLTVTSAKAVARMALQASKTLQHVQPDMGAKLQEANGKKRRRTPGYFSGPQEPTDELDDLEEDTVTPDVSLGPWTSMSPLAPSSGAENLGNGFMRELVSALPKLVGAKLNPQSAQTVDPSQWVAAIQAAKSSGDEALAMQLKAVLLEKITPAPVSAPTAEK